MPCQLLDAWSMLVQVVLAAGSFSSLVYKRHCERPQRKLRIWLFDTSKQALSAGLLHLLNMLIAQLVGAMPGAKSHDPCVVYSVNLLFDVAVGTVVSYYLLRASERALLRLASCGCCCCPQLLRICASTGQYGSLPQIRRWLPQLLLWVLIVCVSKALCACIALRTSLVMQLGTLLLQPLAPFPKMEMVVVMLIAPLFLSCLQLWAQDNFLKLRGPKNPTPEEVYAPLYRCPVLDVDGASIEAIPQAHVHGLDLQIVRGVSAEGAALAQPPTEFALQPLADGATDSGVVMGGSEEVAGYDSGSEDGERPNLRPSSSDPVDAQLMVSVPRSVPRSPRS
eukprot:CAMPEP_0179964956 /NCGR_PEP_ID=MMETSP0983-20121128/31607_1 /TAXON_ID=483367 /ORGANISM="non described non described, Strain CCMP 2436" /LENGTH=336 /DNA_ID=CAMNT_0021877721 /DNA_START=90 /DNA_END=1096 /DNA_ORIENTATION=-